MRLMLAVLFVSLGAVAAHTQAPAADGPFGLRLGMPKAELTTLLGAGTPSPAQPGMATYDRVPKPHPDFAAYQLVASPTHGLCVIQAVGKPLAMNDFGEQLKRQFKSILDPLVEKYGPPERNADLLRPGSIWKKPEDWAMALNREERMLIAIWDLKQTEGLSALMLKGTAPSPGTGVLLLTYESTQADACRRELEQAQRSVF